MFSLFKKKQAQSEPPLKKKIKDMKCRKINYVDEDFDTLASEMSADPKAILRLKPVNYYAIKINILWEKFILSEDYQENYVQFFRYEYDHECGKTDIYPLSAELMSKGSCEGGHNNRPESPCQRPVRKRKASKLDEFDMKAPVADLLYPSVEKTNAMKKRAAALQSSPERLLTIWSLKRWLILSRPITSIV